SFQETPWLSPVPSDIPSVLLHGVARACHSRFVKKHLRRCPSGNAAHQTLIVRRLRRSCALISSRKIPKKRLLEKQMSSRFDSLRVPAEIQLLARIFREFPFVQKLVAQAKQCFTLATRYTAARAGIP